MAKTLCRGEGEGGVDFTEMTESKRGRGRERQTERGKRERESKLSRNLHPWMMLSSTVEHNREKMLKT